VLAGRVQNVVPIDNRLERALFCVAPYSELSNISESMSESNLHGWNPIFNLTGRLPLIAVYI